MIECCTDNVVVFSTLEELEQLPFRFEQDGYFLFFPDHEMVFVIFDSVSRNFEMFRTKEVERKRQAIGDLIDYLSEYTTPRLSPISLKNAIAFLEEEFFAKNNSDFYFDAH